MSSSASVARSLWCNQSQRGTHTRPTNRPITSLYLTNYKAEHVSFIPIKKYMTVVLSTGFPAGYHKSRSRISYWKIHSQPSRDSSVGKSVSLISHCEQQHDSSRFQVPSMPHRYVEEAAMLAAKRSAGVAPEVNLRECVTHMPLPSVNNAAHSGFETQRRCHQKSKTGVSVAPQKGLMSSKNLKKKKRSTRRGEEFLRFIYFENIYLIRRSSPWGHRRV